MSDEVAPEVGVATAPAPRKEHWKAKAKRLREEAIANGSVVPEVENVAPVPAVGATGFLTWSDFCNAVAIDLVTSQFGFQMLTNYTGDEAAQVFYSRMRLAYDSMKKAHATGVASGS